MNDVQSKAKRECQDICISYNMNISITTTSELKEIHKMVQSTLELHTITFMSARFQFRGKFEVNNHSIVLKYYPATYYCIQMAEFHIKDKHDMQYFLNHITSQWKYGWNYSSVYKKWLKSPPKPDHIKNYWDGVQTFMCFLYGSAFGVMKLQFGHGLHVWNVWICLMCLLMVSLLFTMRPQLGHWYFCIPSTWTLISVQSVSAVDPADGVEGEVGVCVV